MKPKEWNEEVQSAVAGLGLPWRISATWVERDGTMCCANLTHTTSGKERTVRVSRQTFAAAADRRAEVVRQLQQR
jgi:hypothetical protein